MNAIGGRFNIGEIDSSQFHPFPALYLGCDLDTVLRESIGDADPPPGLTTLDVALQRPESFSVYSVEGKIDIVLDITNRNNLVPYVNCIKAFKYPVEIIQWAAKKGYQTGVVDSVDKLVTELLHPHWRQYAALHGIPSNPQEFGQQVRDAGIEAIKYPSVKSGKPCLAIFPENFQHSDSYVELCEDPPENSKDVIRRLDRDTWSKLI
ncbi:MAG: RES family NAD+ phosphorylase [Candidatus Lambdaproteobacteria bacterium]|nr:RES family NAD+ phosphorylase [Candidatus Lambdaproteobacteria bacterium]